MTKDLLVRMAGQAKAQVEANTATQQNETAEAVNKARHVNFESQDIWSHIDKKQAVGSVTGHPKALAMRMDYHSTKHTLLAEMEYEDEWTMPRSRRKPKRQQENQLLNTELCA